MANPACSELLIFHRNQQFATHRSDWRFNAEVIDRWCLERNAKDPGGGTSSRN